MKQNSEIRNQTKRFNAAANNSHTERFAFLGRELVFNLTNAATVSYSQDSSAYLGSTLDK